MARLESWEVRDGGMGPAGDRSAGPSRRGERRVIRLADCVSVLPADGESCPRDTGAFLLTTTERSHLLAAQHRQEWMGPICQLAFPVSTGQAGRASKVWPPGGPAHFPPIHSIFTHILSLSKHLPSTYEPGKQPRNYRNTSAGHTCSGGNERRVGSAVNEAP